MNNVPTYATQTRTNTHITYVVNLIGKVELSLKAGIHFAKRNGLVFMMIKWSGFQS